MGVLRDLQGNTNFGAGQTKRKVKMIADKEERKRTAIHEAGHAVIGHHFGRKLEEIFAAQKEDSSYGVKKFLKEEGR